MVDAEGHIATIGKHLKVWNAVDTGVFKMTGDVFLGVGHLMGKHGAKVGLTDLVRFMGEDGHPFATCDVSGMFWADIDTSEDYESIDRLLGEKYGEGV